MKHTHARKIHCNGKVPNNLCLASLSITEKNSRKLYEFSDTEESFFKNPPEMSIDFPILFKRKKKKKQNLALNYLLKKKKTF